MEAAITHARETALSRRQAIVRGCLFGPVIAVHLGLFLLLLRPPAPIPFRQPLPPDSHDAMAVRLIALAPPAPPSRAVPRIAKARSLPPPTHAPSRAKATLPLPDEMPAASVPVAAPVRVDRLPGYIPGGGHGYPPDTAYVAGKPRLPGAPVPHAPALHMLDPAAPRGLAEVVHFVGYYFTGAVDPACLDVEAWARMSPDELIARHMTQGEAARISDQHHCVEPRHGFLF
jgi:hypothetical protein